MSAMKTAMPCLGVLILVGSTAGLLAATAGTSRGWVEPSDPVARVEMNQPAADQPFDPANIGLISRSSKLVGKKIQDDFGRRLGTMEDVLVDLESGRIAGCVVQTDGGRKLVPAAAFFPVSEERIVFNKDRKLLRSSPTFAGTFSAEAAARAYSHFNLQAPDRSNGGTTVSARSLQGKSITASSGQVLGRVQDLALDVPKGAVVYVLAQSQESRGHLHVLPPRALRMSDQRGSLALVGDEARFASGPKVPAQFWTRVTVPEFASSVYRHYGMQANRREQVLTPTGRSDEEVRSAVLREIVNSPSLAAVNSKDLNISVKNGRVKLSGTVGSKGARDDIVDFASRVVGAANVEDQLTVK